MLLEKKLDGISNSGETTIGNNNDQTSSDHHENVSSIL